jgi:uncharacterized membrane protein
VTSLAVVGLGMLLGAGAYESVVMAPNYAAQIPASVEHARNFFVATNPGAFFRTIAPTTQVLLLLSVVLNWRVPGARRFIIGALLLAVLTDVITFSFHYPRNAILFDRPLDQSTTPQLLEAAQQWALGNYVRVGLLATAMLSALRGLMRSAEKVASI